MTVKRICREKICLNYPKFDEHNIEEQCFIPIARIFLVETEKKMDSWSDNNNIIMSRLSQQHSVEAWGKNGAAKSMQHWSNAVV